MSVLPRDPPQSESNMVNIQDCCKQVNAGSFNNFAWQNYGSLHSKLIATVVFNKACRTLINTSERVLLSYILNQEHPNHPHKDLKYHQRSNQDHQTLITGRLGVLRTTSSLNTRPPITYRLGEGDPFIKLTATQSFLKDKKSCRGPKGHINTRISHSGSKAQYKADTRNTVFILMFMWSSWAISFALE